MSLELPTPPAWMADANCTDQERPDIFYVDKGESSRPAKDVCAGCDVIAQCLTYALDNDEGFGVWGGLSTPERRALKRSAA